MTTPLDSYLTHQKTETKSKKQTEHYTGKTTKEWEKQLNKRFKESKLRIFPVSILVRDSYKRLSYSARSMLVVVYSQVNLKPKAKNKDWEWDGKKFALPYRMCLQWFGSDKTIRNTIHELLEANYLEQVDQDEKFNVNWYVLGKEALW